MKKNDFMLRKSDLLDSGLKDNRDDLKAFLLEADEISMNTYSWPIFSKKIILTTYPIFSGYVTMD